jgi:hypothetical protein
LKHVASEMKNDHICGDPWIITKIEKMDKELVPEEYHRYLDIFKEEKAHQFPKLRPWDHKIEIKDLNLNCSKTTISSQQNKTNWTNSSKKT